MIAKEGRRKLTGLAAVLGHGVYFKRIHLALSYLTPTKFEEQWRAKQSA